MKSSAKAILYLILGISAISANAAGCVSVPSSSSVSFKLAKSSQYANCVEPSGASTSPYLVINVHTTKNISFNVRLLEIAPNGSSVIAVESSSLNGVASISTQPGGRRLAVSVIPTSSLALDKDLIVAYVKDIADSQGVAVMDISITEPPNTIISTTPTTPTTPGTGTGTCDQHGFCTLPESQPGTTSAYRLASVAAATNSACNANNTPPPQHPPASGAPDNFDLNAAIGGAETLGLVLDKLNQNPLLQRTMYMQNMFAPGREFDVKNNPAYYANSEFGNALYGAVGKALGFPAPVLLQGAALIQQYQNYKKDGDPRQGNFAALLSGLWIALKDGTNDGPGDAEDIMRGINYYDEVYKKDPNNRNVKDSCKQDARSESSSSQGGGSELGPRSSWDATATPLIITSSCVGNCITFGGTVEVGPIETVKAPSR